MDADGVSPVRLTNYVGIDQFPDWSPDGRRIVFRRDVDIHVLDLMTGEVRASGTDAKSTSCRHGPRPVATWRSS